MRSGARSAEAGVSKVSTASRVAAMDAMAARRRQREWQMA